MALTLSLLQVGGTAPPGIQVTVSGLSGVAGAATVSVKRTQALTTGSITQDVRGLSMLTVTGDSAVSTDYEFSFLDTNTNLSYQCIVYDASGATLSTVTTGFTSSASEMVAGLLATSGNVNCVVRSVETPALSVYAEVADFTSVTYTGRILGTYNVLGRANPVVLRDTMGGRTGTLTLLWLNDLIFQTQGVSQQAFEQLLLTQGTLLVQPMYPAAGISDMYMIAGDIASTRLTMASTNLSLITGNPDSNPDVAMQYAITFTEVDRPLTAGEGTTIDTWQDLLSNPAITTWNDLIGHWTNWLGVLNDPSL